MSLTGQHIIEAAKASNWAFGRFILGRDRLQLFHRAWDELVPLKRLQFIRPRGSLKSTYFTEAATVKAICDDLESRSLIAVHDLEPAWAFVESVKTYLQMPAVQEYCPELRDRVGPDGKYAETWSKYEIKLPRDKPRKEATVTAAATGKSSVSGHHDFITLDDVVDINDARSDTVRESRIEYVVSMFDLAEPWSTIRDIGTPWHPQDAHAFIKNTYRDEWTIDECGIYYEDENRNIVAPPTLWWPENYEERLPELQRHPLHFSRQYLCKAVGGADKLVDMDWFQFLDPPREGYALNILAIDAAFSAKDRKKSSYTAVTALALDSDRDVWIRETYVNRLSMADFVDVEGRIYNLIALLQKYRPDAVVMESGSAQKGVIDLLNVVLRSVLNGQYYITATEEKYNTSDKVTKALRWLTHAKQHGLFVERGCRGWPEALLQLEGFPDGEFDDVPDSISHGFQYLHPYLETGFATGDEMSLVGERSSYGP